jgi:hypothetical protein
MKVIHLVLFTIGICIQNIYGQSKPLNFSRIVEGKLVEYYSCSVKNDTVFMFGSRGYSISGNNFPFVKFLMSKFYRDTVYYDYTRDLDSEFDQFTESNVISSNEKFYLLPNSDFHFRRYFLILDARGKYLSHTVEKDNAQYGYIRNNFTLLKNGNFICTGIKTFKGGSSVSSDVYFIMDSAGRELYISPDKLNNDDVAIESVFTNTKGNAVLLCGKYKYTCSSSDYAYPRFISLDETGLPYKDTIARGFKLVPKTSITAENGDYIVAGGRFDSLVCLALEILSTPAICRYDTNANLIWSISSASLNMPRGYFNMVKKLSDGNYLAVGEKYDSIKLDANGNARNNGFFLKFTSSGQVIWKKEYRVKENSSISTRLSMRDFSELSNGDIVVVGYVRYSGSDEYTNEPNQRGWILKLNKNGEILSSNAEIINSANKNITKIFPNPSNNIVYIDNPSNEKLSFDIFDKSGKKITTGRVDDNKIDVSYLPTGSYYLRINGRLILNDVHQLMITSN